MDNANRLVSPFRALSSVVAVLTLVVGGLAAAPAGAEEGSPPPPSIWHDAPDECWDGFAALDLANESESDLLFGMWGCPVGPAVVTVYVNSDPVDRVLFSGMWEEAGETPFLFTDFDLEVGHFVRVESQVFDLSKEVELNVRITDVDAAENTVSGTALPGAHVQVEIPAPAPVWTITGRRVVADAEGNWSVDFGTSGLDYEWGPGEVEEGAPMFPYRHEPYDLAAGSRVLAAAYDADGDFASTQVVVPGVSGTVLLDGKPLSGVQVSVWTQAPAESQGWSTCTDEEGRFEFPDVTLGVELWAATGPAWDRACENAKFFDPFSNPARPLMSQFWDNQMAPPAMGFEAPRSSIDFDIVRLPNDSPAINNLARSAMTACFDKTDGALGTFDSPADAKATAFLDKMLALVDKEEAKNKIDSEVAERYRTYAWIVGWSWSMTCPADEPTG